MLALVYMASTLLWALPRPLLLPTGPGYLGAILPVEGDRTERFEVVLVDPATGGLWVEQSDDQLGHRIYKDGRWQVTKRAKYTYDNDQLLAVEDGWGVRIRYFYDKEGRLSQIRWPNSKQLRITYDDVGRVYELIGPSIGYQRFQWRGPYSGSIEPNVGYRLELEGNEKEIIASDSNGRLVRAFYEDDQLIGWDDPRGLSSRISSTSRGLQLQDAGTRVWDIELVASSVSSISIAGGQKWQWIRDDSGQIIAIRDSALRKVGVTNRNGHPVRLKRERGDVDLLYNKEGELIEISDEYGQLVKIERDYLGQVLAIEDALGGRYVLQRNDSGKITELILRTGEKCSFDYDILQQLSQIVLPNREVVSLNRDILDHIIQIDHSFWGMLEIDRDVHGNISRIHSSDGEDVLLEYDRYRQLTRMRGEQQYDLRRDVIGNVMTVSSAENKWEIERNIRGEIIKWNEQEILRDSNESIIQLSGRGKDVWFYRDAAGVLTAIQRGEERVDVHRDGLSYPSKWSTEDQMIEVTRDGYGLLLNDGHVESRRDRRGWQSSSQINALKWRWMRDSGGHILKVFGPSSLNIGLDRENYGRLKSIRFPDGALQRFHWRGNQLTEEIIDSDGQRIDQWIYTYGFDGHISEKQSALGEVYQYQSEDSINGNIQLNEDGEIIAGIFSEHHLWGEFFEGELLYEYDDVGLRTVQLGEHFFVIEYNEFHFPTQICDVHSCQHFQYDPRGFVIAYDDGSGIPTTIQWAVDALTEEYAPFLAGGSYWLRGPYGLQVARYGDQERGYLHSISQDSSWLLAAEEMIPIKESNWGGGELYYLGDRFQFAANELWFSGGRAFEPLLQQPIQKDQWWMSTGDVSHIFSGVEQTGIWNDPIAILDSMNRIQLEKGWTNLSMEPALPWLLSSLDRTTKDWGPSLWDYPISEDSMEQWLIERILTGKIDPSPQEIMSMILEKELDKDMNLAAVFLSNVWWKSDRKCVPSLAFFHQCE